MVRGALSRSHQLSALALGIVVSTVLHALLGLMLSWSSAPPAPATAEVPLTVDIDVDEPPAPQEADVPEAEQPAAPVPPPAQEQAEAPPELPPQPPTVEPEAATAAPLDAAIPDAGPADAAIPDAGPADATTPDAGGTDGDAPLLAARDAGAADATAVAAAHMDAGTVVAATTAAPATAGTSDATVAGAADAAAAGTASASDATAAGKERHPGSQANLLAYVPEGEVVSAMIRFDRLRGTRWAQQAEAILAPMPDYRTLIGTRQVSISALFDTLVISSSNPRDVTATTLAGHTVMSSEDARAFVNHAAAPVVWSAARGGALGRRQRSRLVAPHDQRVFLMPLASWMLLAHPRHLGVLAQPSTAEIDTVAAAPAELPGWVARIPGIEAEAGPDPDTGPALVITIANMLPPVVTVRYAGQVSTPQRLSMALEATRGGFFVRGTMLFVSPEQAATFVAKAENARTELLDSRLGTIVLARVHGYNALRGLSLKQNGAKVGYATSISVADGEAMMEQAAELSQRLFAPSEAAEPAGQAPPPPGSATPPPQPATPPPQPPQG